MGLLANVKFRKILTLWVVLILPIIISCHTEYTTQYFCFPPGTEPHKNDWEYKVLVIVSSNKSPITKKSKKNVQIRVYDKNKTVFLSDDYEFVSASINANVVWEKFEEIRVRLFDIGNEYAKDPYNVNLLKTGPKSLIILTYHYNREDNKFRRIN